MSVSLSPLAGAGWQFFDNNGVPLNGGLLYTYAAGTTTPTATYTSDNGVTANANPIVLDSSGRTPSEVWLTDGTTYKIAVYTSTNVLIRTWDDIAGVNDPTALTALQTALASSTGSSMIGFIQSGAGAVARTSQAKMRESVSVKDFGADPSASATTNATAFQAAVDSGAAVVFVPAGTYLINNTVTLSETYRTVLRGEGPRRSVLSVNTSTFTGNVIRARGRTTVESLGIVATGAVAGTAIRCTDADEYAFTGHICLSNVYVSGFSNGIDVNNIFDLLVESAEVYGCSLGILVAPSYNGVGDNGYVTTLTFNKCYVTNCTSYGVYVNPTLVSKNISFNDTIVEANTGASAQIFAARCNPLLFTNCYQELVPSAPAILLNSCVTYVRGHYFNGTGGISLAATSNDIVIEDFYGTSSTDVIFANGTSLQTLRVENSTVPGTSTLNASKMQFVNSTINGTYYRQFSSNLDLTVTDGDLANTSRLSAIVALKRTVTATINANTTSALIADYLLPNTWTSDFTVGVANFLDSYNPGLILTVQCATTGSAQYINVLATNTTGSNITVTSKALRVLLMKGTAMAI